jgi:hypothetical protein
VPAGFGREPEDIRGEVFIAVLGGIGALGFVFDEPFAFGIGKAKKELFALFLEGVGDVFEEDQAEANVLVFRGVHVAAHFVGGDPKLGFEIEAGIVGLLFVLFLCHRDRSGRRIIGVLGHDNGGVWGKGIGECDG